MTATDGSTFRDPVCGMQVQEDSPHRYELAGKVYRFCSESCLEKFEADPVACTTTSLRFASSRADHAYRILPLRFTKPSAHVVTGAGGCLRSSAER